MAPPRSAFGAPPQGGAAYSPAKPVLWRLLGGSLLVLASGAAHAGLFDDEEARKAILELRTRLTALEDQGKARGNELAAANAQNAQLLEQLAALRRSLLDLNNQLESLRADVSKLRGTDEQLARDIADAQKRQKDVAQAFDDRLRKLEPVKVSMDGREFAVDPEEKRAFDEAFGSIRNGDFDKAVALLSNFQRRYPGSGYSDAARFWLGNSQYGRRDYKEAINTFRAFVNAAPDHPRAPEALLAVANSQAEMKDAKSARKTIEDLMKAYPQSEAAQAGKERLASLK
jgi:tol-pal system protein YbgF